MFDDSRRGTLLLCAGICLACLLLDIRMPEMSGIDLLRAIRDRGLHPIFLMVSGYAEFEYAQEALRLGAFDYLMKPVELDAIHDVLGNCGNG